MRRPAVPLLRTVQRRRGASRSARDAHLRLVRTPGNARRPPSCHPERAKRVEGSYPRSAEHCSAIPHAVILSTPHTVILSERSESKDLIPAAPGTALRPLPPCHREPARSPVRQSAPLFQSVGEADTIIFHFSFFISSFPRTPSPYPAHHRPALPVNTAQKQWANTHDCCTSPPTFSIHLSFFLPGRQGAPGRTPAIRTGPVPSEPSSVNSDTNPFWPQHI